MIYCKNCGAQLPDSAVFCSECGGNVGQSAAAPVQQPFQHQPNFDGFQTTSYPNVATQAAQYHNQPSANTNKTKIIAIVIAVIVVVAVALGILLALDGNKGGVSSTEDEAAEKVQTVINDGIGQLIDGEDASTTIATMVVDMLDLTPDEFKEKVYDNSLIDEDGAAENIASYLDAYLSDSSVSTALKSLTALKSAEITVEIGDAISSDDMEKYEKYLDAANVSLDIDKGYELEMQISAGEYSTDSAQSLGLAVVEIDDGWYMMPSPSLVNTLMNGSLIDLMN
jgi:hypothetical protein